MREKDKLIIEALFLFSSSPDITIQSAHEFVFEEWELSFCRFLCASKQQEFVGVALGADMFAHHVVLSVQQLNCHHPAKELQGCDCHEPSNVKICSIKQYIGTNVTIRNHKDVFS